jgi:hypothetical protein
MAYTNSMSVFAKVTRPEPPKKHVVVYAGIFTAAIITILVTAQLFSYEKFPSVLSGYWLLGDQVMVHLIAALLVSAEVLAIPFLLRMNVSPLMRGLSMVCGWAVAATWLLLSVWAVVSVNSLTNGGLLGGTVRIAPGAGQLLFSILLVALVGYVSWGQLPHMRVTSKK